MLGLLLNVVVHSADVQDRDGAPLVLDRRTRRLFPFIERIFADAGYQGAKTAAAIARPAPGRWRSSSAVSCIVSSSCPSDGLSSEPSPGSAAIDGFPAISSAVREPSRPSSAARQSG
jgi:hypothetical protein